MVAEETNLKLTGDVFEDMRNDADSVIQNLINNMIEKGSDEAKISINICVNLREESIFRADEPGTTRMVIKPAFTHKISSVMQIKNEKHGAKNYESKELVFDEETNEWVLKPITGESQMNIFDVEFNDVTEEVENPKAIEKQALAVEKEEAEEVVENNEEEVDDSEDEDFEEPLEF